MDPLHRAVLAGRPTEVQYLLERRNCDPNIRDENLRTPLIACSLSARVDMAEASAVILLQKGAKISLSDRLGKNALSWACLKNKVGLIRIFLSDYPNRFRFDLRWGDRDGNTALHLAAREGNTAIVDLLLGAYDDNDFYASVTDRNTRGETPLHLAAKRGNSSVVLSLIPITPEALFSRRGAVDFRSAPKWARAAMEMTASTGVSEVNHSRPSSEHPIRDRAHTNTLSSRKLLKLKRRPQTVTVTSSNLTRLPETKKSSSSCSYRNDISALFKISDIQIAASSAWRRPARAPPPTAIAAPSVGDHDAKTNRPRSSASRTRLSVKNDRCSSLTSRSRSSLRRGSEDEIAEKQSLKSAKPVVPVPTVVVNEITDDALSTERESSAKQREVAIEDLVQNKSSKRSQFFYHTMSEIPESPVQSGNFLTPFDGPGMAFQFLSRDSSLQSLVSDIGLLPGGLLTGTHPAFDRSETVPVIHRNGNIPLAQIRRTKSAPSLNTACFDSETTKSKHRRSRFESKYGYRVRSGATSRKRGLAIKVKSGLAIAGKRQSSHSKLSPLKVEVSNHGIQHQQLGEHAPPGPPASPTSSSRSYRRFVRPGREAEVAMQRRRTELERRIRSIQKDIEKLDKRKSERKYKPLLPEWVPVDQDTTMEELVATLNDKCVMREDHKKTHRSQENKVIDVSLNDTIVKRPYSKSSALSTHHGPDLHQERHYSSCTTSFDSEAEDLTTAHPKRRLKTHCQYSDINAYARSPREVELQKNVLTLRIARPAQAPIYKQSRSIYIQPGNQIPRDQPKKR